MGPSRGGRKHAAIRDRRSYQMDCAADPGQALRETAFDIAEGADVVMVKPALAYLDIVPKSVARFPCVPLRRITSPASTAW